MSNQTRAEKRALDAAWRATPQVQAFTAAMAAHAPGAGEFNAQGLTAMLQHAIAWIAANGPLPDSGILCD